MNISDIGKVLGEIFNNPTIRSEVENKAHRIGIGGKGVNTEKEIKASEQPLDEVPNPDLTVKNDDGSYTIKNTDTSRTSGRNLFQVTKGKDEISFNDLSDKDISEALKTIGSELPEGITKEGNKIIDKDGKELCTINSNGTFDFGVSEDGTRTMGVFITGSDNKKHFVKTEMNGNEFTSTLYNSNNKGELKIDKNPKINEYSSITQKPKDEYVDGVRVPQMGDTLGKGEDERGEKPTQIEQLVEDNDNFFDSIKNSNGEVNLTKTQKTQIMTSIKEEYDRTMREAAENGLSYAEATELANNNIRNTFKKEMSNIMGGNSYASIYEIKGLKTDDDTLKKLNQNNRNNLISDIKQYGISEEEATKRVDDYFKEKQLLLDKKNNGEIDTQQYINELEKLKDTYIRPQKNENPNVTEQPEPTQKSAGQTPPNKEEIKKFDDSLKNVKSGIDLRKMFGQDYKNEFSNQLKSLGYDTDTLPKGADFNINLPTMPKENTPEAIKQYNEEVDKYNKEISEAKEKFKTAMQEAGLTGNIAKVYQMINYSPAEIPHLQEPPKAVNPKPI